MYNQERLMHVSDVASVLGISSQMVYKLIASGELKAFKTGRVWKITTQSVTDYMNNKLRR